MYSTLVGDVPETTKEEIRGIFKTIRDLATHGSQPADSHEAQHMWDDASAIRERALEIQAKLRDSSVGGHPAEDPLPIIFLGRHISKIFEEVRDCAHYMAMVVHPRAEESWKLACEIPQATRRIQDLIRQLELLRVELCPRELDSNASVGFTCPTAFSQVSVLSSVQRTSETDLRESRNVAWAYWVGWPRQRDVDTPSNSSSSPVKKSPWNDSYYQHIWHITDNIIYLLYINYHIWPLARLPICVAVYHCLDIYQDMRQTEPLGVARAPHRTPLQCGAAGAVDDLHQAEQLATSQILEIFQLINQVINQVISM